jgi:acyl-CoA dehydrogenase
MRALTQAARTICYATALAIDRSERANDETTRRQAHAQASLLTPVAKAFATDAGNEVTSLGIQVHGGMGYIEETGAAQLFRDARIAAIYEGTNGIQAIDLVTRKLPLSDGAIVNAHLEELRSVVNTLGASNDPAFGWTAVRLGEAVESLARATTWLIARLAKEPEAALAGATPYLRLFGLATGGCFLAKQALAAIRVGENAAAPLAIARFFAENFVVGASALERTVMEGASGVIDADAALASP